MPTLMIVDDEALARFSLRTIISQAFSDVSVVAEAENGPDAIAAYERFRPDAVLMDVRLPGMSGITVSEKILEKFPSAKIVICTAYDNFSFISHALDIGVKGFLLKPVRREEVVQKLEKLFFSNASIIEQLAEQKILELLLSDQPTSPENLAQLQQYYDGLDSGVLLLLDSCSPDSTWNLLKKLSAALPNGRKAFICRQEGYGCLFATHARNLDIWNQLMETIAREDPALRFRWAAAVVRGGKLRECFDRLCHTLRESPENTPAEEAQIPVSIGERLREKLNFPDSEIDDMSLDKLARELEISPQYLSVVFKDTLGVTFIGYMTQRRMNYAAHLLREENRSISEAAQLCGYSDLTYFKRLFKKTMGISPREYARGRK